MRFRKLVAAIYARAHLDDRQHHLMFALAVALFGDCAVRVAGSNSEVPWPWLIESRSRIALGPGLSPAAANMAIAEALAVMHRPTLDGWRELALELAMPIRAVRAMKVRSAEEMSARFNIPIEAATVHWALLGEPAKAAERPISGVRAPTRAG